MKILPGIALSSLLLFGTTPLAALAWRADVGLGGWIAPGTWCPLRVEVPPETGPWSLEIRALSVSGRESPPIVWNRPTGGVFEAPFFVADATRLLNLRLVVSGIVRAEKALPLARLFPGHLVGVDGLSTVARAALSEVLLPDEPVRVVPVKPRQWPSDALSYGSFSVLVADPAPVLSPSQLQALRAWIAMGGRLILIGADSGSLKAQLGEGKGWGRVVVLAKPPKPEEWKEVVALKPYGQSPLLGLDLGAPGSSGSKGQPLSELSITLVLIWAGLTSVVLLFWSRKSLSGALAVSVLAGGVFWFLAPGVAIWDQGIPVKVRELVVPGAGRLVSWDVRRSTQSAGLLDWPEASPWIDLTDRVSSEAGTLVRWQEPDRVVVEQFLPPLDRPASWRVRGKNGNLWWAERQGDSWAPRETVPEGLGSEVPWLAKLVGLHGDQPWLVGRDGEALWVEPEGDAP